MSEDTDQLSCVFNESKLTNAVDITAILTISDNLSVTADRKTNTLKLYNELFEEMDVFLVEKAGWYQWYGITDLTQIGHNEFAALIPGRFWNSDIRTYTVTMENTIEHKSTIKADRRSFGICYQKDFFFIASSPYQVPWFDKREPAYVKMVGKQGKIKHKFQLDRDKKAIFSEQLSKIYVTEKFIMYICDEGKQELVILKVDPFEYDITILTCHNYSVVHFSRLKNGSCFLATNHPDGVVLLQANGKWIFNNFLPVKRLQGKPKAIACQEHRKQLIVVVEKSKWLPPNRKWLEVEIFGLQYRNKTDISIQIDD